MGEKHGKLTVGHVTGFRPKLALRSYNFSGGHNGEDRADLFCSLEEVFSHNLKAKVMGRKESLTCLHQVRCRLKNDKAFQEVKQRMPFIAYYILVCVLTN